jgi:cell division protein FtsW (lipid II flippase)
LWVRLDFGLIQMFFQPGEVAKLLFVVFLASYLADRAASVPAFVRPAPGLELRQLAPLLMVWAASVGVLVFQRDLGASLLLLGVFVGMLYAATGRKRYPLVGLGLMALGATAAYFLFPHVQRRFVAWLAPFSHFDDAGYQISQAWFGMSSGSLSGSGLGLGRPDFIPLAETDFIFAALGEELGFAGTAALLGAFLLFVTVGLGIALRSRDPFRKLLTGGLTLLLGLQTFLIIGGVLRLVPVTGLPLPFTSYGGSAMVAGFMLLALMLRASHEESQ